MLLIKLLLSRFFHSLNGELCYTSLRAEYLHKLFGITPHRFVYSPPLFIYLWIHGYYFVSESQPNTVLFCCSNYSSVSHWERFQLVSVSLLQTSFTVFEYFLTFQHYKVLQVHLVHLFLVPGLESALVPLWKNGIRNQETGTRCAHCYLGCHFF